jgi:hypothetical protein
MKVSRGGMSREPKVQGREVLALASTVVTDMVCHGDKQRR